MEYDNLGSDYLHDGNSDKGTKSVTYTPSLAPGRYEVFIHWTSGSNRASNVPVDITSADGLTTKTVDERTGGGQWVSLGVFNFDGQGGGVTLRTDSTDGYVIADGVKFTPVDTPVVQYAYSGPEDGGRLESMTYPNGRVLHYVYASGVDDSISRLSYIADDDGSGGIGTHLEARRVRRGLRTLRF